jgi:hypothetical protein
VKIFVAHGFNERDAWIRTMVIPIMGYLGIEVLTGEELEGVEIPSHVVDRIKEADAFIGFLTRRGDPNERKVYPTHAWVIGEIGVAVGVPLEKVLEVREGGIDEQAGIAANRQRLAYEESKRAEFLVELVDVLCRWARGIDVTLKVTPGDVAVDMVPYIGRPDTGCTYRLLNNGQPSAPREARVYLETGGPTIWAGGIPPRTMVDFQIEAPGRVWASPFMSVDSLEVQLERKA